MAPTASPTYYVARNSLSLREREREREGEREREMERARETTHWVGTDVKIRLPLTVPGGPLLC